MKFSKLSLTLTSAALIAACGGGGDDAVTPPVVPPIVAPVVSLASTIVTSVPAPTYAAGSEELAAFNLLNKERTHCGFGLLAQNTKLDVAAKNHASYLILNHLQGHYQASGDLGFTGVTPADRVLSAGYAASSIGSYGQPSEAQTTVPNTNVLLGAGMIATRGLLSAPYHLMGMFSGYKDVGVSLVLAGTLLPSHTYVIPVFNFATPASFLPQLPGDAEILTYPCQDSTGVNFQLANNENPHPIPGRHLGAQPIGHPILVSVRNGNVLTITSASLIKVSTGAAVTLRTPYSTKATDVNPAYLYANEGYVLPDVPLEPNTQYQANITGGNNGAAFSRTFTFTTGS